MSVVSIRLTHHKTPNKFFHKIYKYFRNNNENIYNKLTLLREEYKIDGIFLLSTCHRMELYLSGIENKQNDLLENGVKILTKLFRGYFTNYIDYSETADGEESLKHLLAVTAGIDSLIIGEVDIIEQVKEAHAIAKKYKNTDKNLDLILEYADNLGRKMRKETEIEIGLTSFASIPMEYIKDQPQNLLSRKYIIIGAGMLGRRIIKNLINKNIKNIFLLNRNYEKTIAIAKEFNIVAIEIEKIKSILTGNDVIIACSAGGNIDAMRQLKDTKEKNYYIFDFGIPPNTPKEIQKIQQVNYIPLELCREIIVKDCRGKKKKVSYLKNYIYNEVKFILKSNFANIP